MMRPASRCTSSSASRSKPIVGPGRTPGTGVSAAEPDVLVKELARDEAIAAADTLLLTVPNQLGVDYNAHVIEGILKYVAPELGWR